MRRSSWTRPRRPEAEAGKLIILIGSSRFAIVEITAVTSPRPATVQLKGLADSTSSSASFRLCSDNCDGIELVAQAISVSPRNRRAHRACPRPALLAGRGTLEAARSDTHTAPEDQRAADQVPGVRASPSTIHATATPTTGSRYIETANRLADAFASTLDISQ